MPWVRVFSPEVTECHIEVLMSSLRRLGFYTVVHEFLRGLLIVEDYSASSAALKVETAIMSTSCGHLHCR